MNIEKRYCSVCHKECEYTILQTEDAVFVAWGSSHVEAQESSHVEAQESSHVVAWGSSHVVARGSSHVVAWGSSHVVAWGSSHVEAQESSHVEAWGSSHVVARGSSHVVAWGSSHVVAWGSSHVEAQESSHVVAQGSSHVVAQESSHVVAWGSSHVVAQGSSHVVARGSSHVVARGSSHVVAWGSSHVVAWGSSHVVAQESSHVVATSPYTTSIIKSASAKVTGGTIIGATRVPAQQWLEKCGVSVRRGCAMLFKSTNPDFTTRNGISFKPRTYHEAPDWDVAFTGECGYGIHYSPTVAQARTFRDEGVYVACRVKVSDMANLPAFAEYPDKIRARGGYALYRVDEFGNKIPTKKEV